MSSPVPLIDWDAVREEATAILSQYLRINTTNLPGNETEAAKFFQDILAREGVSGEIITRTAGRGNLIARLPGRGTKLPFMLLSHSDVVPADPKSWSRAPFGGEVVNGEIWGRGALDMKNQGVMHLLTFLLLKRQGVPLERDVLFAVTADEEMGGYQGARWLCEERWDAVACEYVLSEGAEGSRGIYTDDGRTVFAVAVQQKNTCQLTLVAQGEAGHGSQPHDNNPNDALVAALARVKARVPSQVEIPLVAEMRRCLGGLRRGRVTDPLLRNTVALTTLKAGVGDWNALKVNVIPSRAEATLDCRLLPGQDPHQFVEEIRKAVDDPRVTVTPRAIPVDGPESPYAGDPFFRLLDEVLIEAVPGAVVTPAIMTGGSDTKFFRQRGAKAYGICPILLTEADIRLFHNDDERIRIEELARGTRLTYEIVTRFVKAG